VVHVHVQPRAGRDEIVGRHGAALRVRVQAPPVDGRANEAVGRLLAAAFGVAPSKVELVSGDRSRLKRFRLHGVAREDARARLEDLLAGGVGGSAS
jgi:uncharacterized protein (TIGR00251 family)